MVPFPFRFHFHFHYQTSVLLFLIAPPVRYHITALQSQIALSLSLRYFKSFLVLGMMWESSVCSIKDRDLDPDLFLRIHQEPEEDRKGHVDPGSYIGQRGSIRVYSFGKLPRIWGDCTTSRGHSIGKNAKFR